MAGLRESAALVSAKLREAVERGMGGENEWRQKLFQQMAAAQRGNPQNWPQGLGLGGALGGLGSQGLTGWQNITMSRREYEELQRCAHRERRLSTILHPLALALADGNIPDDAVMLEHVESGEIHSVTAGEIRKALRGE